MFRRRRDTDDFAAEIESHLQFEIDRLRARGAQPGRSGRGGASRVRQRRAARRNASTNRSRWLWWDRLAQDVRLRRPLVAHGARADARRRADHGAWHRRDDGDVQRGRRDVAASAAVSAGGPPRERGRRSPRHRFLRCRPLATGMARPRAIGHVRPCRARVVRREQLDRRVAAGPSAADERHAKLLRGARRGAAARVARSRRRIGRRATWARLSSATVCGRGTLAATRTFSRRASGSTPICIASSASCRPVSTRRAGPSTSGTSTCGRPRTSMARRCRISRRGACATSPAAIARCRRA